MNNIDKKEVKFGGEEAESISLVKKLMIYQGIVNGIIMLLWLSVGLLFPLYQGSRGTAIVIGLIAVLIFWLIVIEGGRRLKSNSRKSIIGALVLQIVAALIWIVTLFLGINPISLINVLISLLLIWLLGGIFLEKKAEVTNPIE